MNQQVRIAVIDTHPIRAAILATGLREAGYTNVTHIGETEGLLRKLENIDPEVIVIDLADPSRDTLEQMFQVSRSVRRPVAMFIDQSDRETTDAAIESGVSAYVVDGLRKERVKPIIEMAISRFNAFARLTEELEQVRSQLEERKNVDEAKAILMRMKTLDEPQAYALLRRTAMNEHRRIVDVARALITTARMLK